MFEWVLQKNEKTFADMLNLSEKYGKYQITFWYFVPGIFMGQSDENRMINFSKDYF